MSAIVVFTDVQPVHICLHLKKCVLGFHDSLTMRHFKILSMLILSSSFFITVCLFVSRSLELTCLCVASLTLRIFPLSGNTPYRSLPITPKPDTARDLAESPSVRIRVQSEECFPPKRQRQLLTSNSLLLFTERIHQPNTEAREIKQQIVPNADFFHINVSLLM